MSQLHFTTVFFVNLQDGVHHGPIMKEIMKQKLYVLMSVFTTASSWECHTLNFLKEGF